MKNYFTLVLTIAWAGLTLYLTTIPNFHPSSDTTLSWLLSNGGHLFFFGVLAVLLKLDNISRLNSILCTSIYGLMIEYIQVGIPGRSFAFTDWLLDTLGAVSFLFILKKLQSQL